MKEHRQQKPGAATSPARSAPPASPSTREEWASGFLTAAGILLGGGLLFFGLFWIVHRASGMGSGNLTPHKVAPVGPLDRDQVRKFVNSPSPPPLDLGISDASSWNDYSDS